MTTTTTIVHSPPMRPTSPEAHVDLLAQHAQHAQPDPQPATESDWRLVRWMAGLSAATDIVADVVAS